MAKVKVSGNGPSGRRPAGFRHRPPRPYRPCAGQAPTVEIGDHGRNCVLGLFQADHGLVVHIVDLREAVIHGNWLPLSMATTVAVRSVAEFGVSLSAPWGGRKSGERPNPAGRRSYRSETGGADTLLVFDPHRDERASAGGQAPARISRSACRRTSVYQGIRDLQEYSRFRLPSRSGSNSFPCNAGWSGRSGGPGTRRWPCRTGMEQRRECWVVTAADCLDCLDPQGQWPQQNNCWLPSGAIGASRTRCIGPWM